MLRTRPFLLFSNRASRAVSMGLLALWVAQQTRYSLRSVGSSWLAACIDFQVRDMPGPDRRDEHH